MAKFHRKSGRSGSSPPLVPTKPLVATNSGPLPQVVLAKPTTHPNIFRKRIRRILGKPGVGDLVHVTYELDDQVGATGNLGGARSEDGLRHTVVPSPKTEVDSSAMNLEATPTLGFGWYNPKSEIAVRMVRWEFEAPDEGFWEDLVERAISLRCQVLRLDACCNCYRVIHAEADGFPGLVVDRYGTCLSAEYFSVAAGQRAEQIVAIVARQLGIEQWCIQPGPHLVSQEGYELAASRTDQFPAQVRIHENRVQYEVRFAHGHKTGFFCDQRDNRHRLADFSRGKSVLDLCCYSGGFSVSAAKSGARDVVGVDLDQKPLEVAKRNANINGVRVKFTQADAFAYMRDMLRGGRRFDIVVLDPPKLIRNRGELEEGTRRHFDLNRLAVQLVSPGGLLLTCSCAGLLDSAEFVRLVKAATRSAFQNSAGEGQSGISPPLMQILAQHGAAACHPVSANCPETAYFKSLWIRL